jgi:hypothetical protein
MRGLSIQRLLLRATLLSLVALPGIAQSTQPPAETARWNVRVTAVAGDQQSLDVEGGRTGADHDSATPSNDVRDHLAVADATLRDGVKKLQKGDYITLIYTSSEKQNVLTKFSVDQAGVTPAAVPIALALSGLFCLLFYYLLSGLHPMRLIIGEDNRYSNSKFQVALWFAVLITTYIAVILLRVWSIGGDFFGGVNIPTHLLTLSGLSAFTYGAAKGITTSKVNDAAAQGKADPKNSASVKPSLLLDLTHDDGVSAGGNTPTRGPMLDLGDFQMIVVTLVAVVVYFGIIYTFLGSMPKTMQVSLPDVDTTILATFGLGQGAYLTKKAVGNVGQS